MRRIILESRTLSALARELQLKLGEVVAAAEGSTAKAALTGSILPISYSTSSAGMNSAFARGDHVHKGTVGASYVLGRSPGVWYTNTGSAATLLYISFEAGTPTGAASVQLGSGTTVAYAASKTTGTFVPLHAPIGPGQQYILTSNTSLSAYLHTWTEYRLGG